jgi:IS5 family transposase
MLQSRAMVRTHHQQPTLWTGFLKEEVDDLWEPWMRGAEVLLDDEELIDQVFEAQGRRWKRSGTRGRLQTPSEVVLRLLVLKHIRNWSYQSLEREVRANLVYGSFARIGGEKVPDAKTMGRLGQTIGPEVVVGLHRRIVELAVEKKVVQGRKMRVDTTVVETNIHYPTDSSLLSDGTRVLTRLMKKVASTVGELKQKVRDRMRSVRKKVVSVAIAARRQGEAGEQQRRGLYKELLSLSRKIVNQAGRVAKEVAPLPKKTQAQVRGLVEQMEGIGERTKQVLRQNQSAHLRRRHEVSRQGDQHVGAAHRNHPQRQGQQAQRIRQDGEGARGRESNRHSRRSVRPAASGLRSAGGCGGQARSSVWAHAGMGGGRRGFLLAG